MDKINQPAHYQAHGIIKEQPIDVMRYMMTDEAYRGYLVGNIIKYVSRYDLKNGIEDLDKASKYISFLKEDLMREQDEGRHH